MSWQARVRAAAWDGLERNPDASQPPETDLGAVARSVACPRCGSPVGASCQIGGRFTTAVHPERVDRAQEAR